MHMTPNIAIKLSYYLEFEFREGQSIPLASKVPIPDDRDTLYWCKGFTLPPEVLDQKRYIVKARHFSHHASFSSIECYIMWLGKTAEIYQYNKCFTIGIHCFCALVRTNFTFIAVQLIKASKYRFQGYEQGCINLHTHKQSGKKCIQQSIGLIILASLFFPIVFSNDFPKQLPVRPPYADLPVSISQ